MFEDTLITLGGLDGVGKTSLIKQAMQRCEENGTQCMYIHNFSKEYFMEAREYSNVSGYFRQLILRYLSVPDHNYNINNSFIHPKQIKYSKSAITAISSSMCHYYNRLHEYLIKVSEENPDLTHIFFDRFVECTIAFLSPFLNDNLIKTDKKYATICTEAYKSLYKISLNWGCHYHSYIFLPKKLTISHADHFLRGLKFKPSQITPTVLRKTKTYLQAVAKAYQQMYDKQKAAGIVACDPHLIKLDSDQYPSPGIFNNLIST